ncbi:RHE_PE00001 family protein [Rhizobium sp.]
MRYDLSKLPLQTLLRPVTDATAALVRLDERIAGSRVGAGWINRMHFADACASLWMEGELVHREDLVLHDAGHDIRTPTHELTIARDVLHARRRIAGQAPGWALDADGLRSLRGDGAKVPAPAELGDAMRVADGDVHEAEGSDPLDAELAAIDAVLARSTAAITQARMSPPAAMRENAALIYDLDWNEDQRLAEWHGVLAESEGLPPVLRAAVLLDAWNRLDVLQHAPWLGRQLAAALLRQAGVTTGSHLAAINTGLRSVPVERRRHPGRNIRLLALLSGIAAAAELGLKEHDRLALSRQLMERRLVGRRTSSKLPELVDLVIARPLVSAGMIAEELGITSAAAVRIVEELELRELTGRGRFRAWGVA